MVQGLSDRISSPQSLRLAWMRVKENQGGPGIDQVTLEQFEQKLEDNLTTLQSQLEMGEYKPLPVLRAYVDKQNGSERPIGIPAIRDRVVQESLLSAISPVFEKEFLDCSFAYRPSRSALAAVNQVETLVKDGCPWVLDGDIENFFGSIDQDLLLQFVAQRISDDKVLQLISRFLTAGVFENMNLREEYLGIVQGSALSPLLANIYLHPLDQKLTEAGYHLIRYADDFVALEASQERAAKALADTADILRALKLDLNEKKTKLLHAREGFVFLGYYIDTKGKGASRKAIDIITRRLTEISRTDGRRKADVKIEELKQCLRGWSSYFCTCRGIEPQDILVLITLVEMSLELGDEENARKLLSGHSAFTIQDPDIHYRLGHLAQTLGMIDEALDEFSRALVLQSDHFQAREALKRINLIDEDVYRSIERLRRLIHLIPGLPQPYRDLAHCYAEISEYGLAKEAYQKASELETEIAEPEPIPEAVIPSLAEPPPLSFSEDDVALFLSLFRGKEGHLARQWLDEKGRRGFYPEARSLTAEQIKSHLAGEQTLGLYLMTEEDKVHLSVIDIDIDQKALLEYARDEPRFAGLHRLTTEDAAKIASVCDDLEIPLLIEDSGYKGRHLWFFFATPIPARLARRFLRFICDRAGEPPGGVHREIFPTSDKVKGQGFGCLIKLPLGIHKRTNRRCFFLDRMGNPLPDQAIALSQVSLISQQKIEEILLTYTTKPKAVSAKKEEEPTLVKNLLSGCKIINYLVNKAQDTHYLDNSERVTLLYTLGHLGEEGKSFLHKVISNCINYDYDFTEKQIKKIKPYPISCARIREKHEDFALDVGCDCTFKLPPKGYPSPILHAFNQPKAWPITEVPPLEKSTEVSLEKGISRDEINGWLKKYIELKKQLRGVEKSISRIEQEMGSCFNRLGADDVETDYGILMRRKSGDNFDWIIKL